MNLKGKFLAMYRSDRVYAAEWIVAIVTGLFVFATSCTWDLQSLTIWSTNVWDSIADGQFRSLYALTAQNLHHVHHAHMGSELVSVLPWSVWNLPIWIVQRFFGKEILESPFMLAYSKLFLVFCSVIMLRCTKKIAFLLTGDKTKSIWAMFLTASSTYLYLSVCYSGQNDILMMTASVLAVYCLLRDKRRGFMLWSILAIAIKPFFLLAFLAVLVLTEKNFLRLIGKAILACSGMLVQKLLFMGAPGYAESMNSGPAKEMLEEMFPTNLETSFGKISFFAIALVLIYIYGYTRDFSRDAYKKPQSLAGKYAVYMIAATYTSYLMFSPFSFYRLAILTPYLYLVLVQNKKMRLYNALLDTAMQFSLLMRMVLRGSKMFRVDFVNRSLAQPFFGYTVKFNDENSYANIDNYIYSNVQLLDKYQPMFAGVAVVCAILLLAFNHPEKHPKLPLSGDKPARVLVWARMLLILPFVLLSLYLYAKTAH